MLAAVDRRTTRWRCATVRCSSSSTPQGRGSPRLCGLSLGDVDHDDASGAAVRQGLEGADRAVRPARRGRARRMARPVRAAAPRTGAVGATRRLRGSVPEPSRGPSTPAGGMGDRQEVRRRASGSAAGCRRTCCATRVRRICSITAPTCASSRNCSGMRRSRPRRCTPRSARSGCSMSTDRLTRGPAVDESDRPSCSAGSSRPCHDVSHPLRTPAWAESHLLDGELQLWRRMSAPDRRHAITVGRRFESMGRSWSRDELAGALLHDVGKLDCRARHVRPRRRHGGRPAHGRFRRYHDHERIGAEMLAAAGSSQVTTDLVRGRGRAAPALAEADSV